MATGRKQQHVVAVPMPSQGHLNPLMRFCQLLAEQEGFVITFVDFDPIHARLQQVQDEDQDKDHTAAHAPPAAAPPPPPSSKIRRVRIPIDGLDLSNNFNVSFRDFFATLPSMAPHLEQLILSLNREGPPVTCLLSDLTITLPTQDLADKLGIPRIVLYPCAASRLLFTHYVTQGEHISIQGVMEALAIARTRKGDVWLQGLPGLPTLFYDDIPHFEHVISDTVFLWETAKESWKVSNARAHAVVVNSFEDLEESTFNTLSKASNVPIYDVGFWAEPLSKDNATSLWKEDTTCIAWLDQQPASSVLYVSFGSITLLSQSQFQEFQDGLISSKQRFLWVFRPGLVPDIDYLSCVATIMSKCDGRGYIISWAPQVQVLAHPSVGGFLTHCGWNSTVESIVSGVPMLCWPYFSDQPLNSRFIVDVWKVGLGFKPSKQDKSLIERDEIDKVIRALMEGEEGRLIQQNATNLKKKSEGCFLESGSSYLKLKALVESLWS